MSQDDKVIAYLSPAEMVSLMNETGMITVHETVNTEGLPVIHAALKVVNAQTGEQLPGGLPFSVVMFKSPREPGYSNIAIGTVVPAAELQIALPQDYFNFCNQRHRFARVFPLDDRAFVLQMDLFVRNATREYVKFSFGVWAALFSQVLFDLMGRGRDALTAAAEAYAAARMDFSQQYVSAVTASDESAVEQTATEAAPEGVPEEAPLPEAVAEPAPEAAKEPVAEAGASEPVAEPKAEAETTAPAEVTAEAKAEAAPEAAAEGEPKAEAAAEPVAEAIAEAAPAAVSETKEPAVA
jgi:hypothetical protein